MRVMRATVLVGVALIVGLALIPACDDNPAAPNNGSNLTSCFNCHGDQAGSVNLLAIGKEYEQSLHATTDTWVRRSSPCSGCHTNEGFHSRVARNDTFPTATFAATSPVGCFTCHAPHTSGNFGLTTQATLTFFDGSGTFNHGKGNLCAHCHQNRPASPAVPAAGATITPTSFRWGPHYGTQSNMFTGKGGFTSAANPAANSWHTTGVTDACVTCHMQTPPASGNAGGHTWWMRDGGSGSALNTGCNTAGCHTLTSAQGFNHRDAQTTTIALIEQLRARLLGAGLIYPSTHANADYLVPQTLTREQAMAYWNFRMVLMDGSNGVHNTAYGLALLRSALEFVPGPAPEVARNETVR